MSGTGDAVPRLPAQAGTTLIEALVVVTITTMVALITLPQMGRSLLTLSRRQAVAVVAARLRQARAEALGRDGPVVFAVAADGRAYGVSDGRVTPTPPGVTVSAPDDDGGLGRRIIFYGDGSSNGGTVVVKAGDRAIRVLVGRGAGAVAVAGA